MSIKRINELPEGSGSLSNDDLFLFMDDPSGSGVTKKISLSDIGAVIGGGGGSSSFDAAVEWTTNHTLADGTRYLANDLVYNSGNLYRAKFDNESIPVTDTIYWENVGPGYRLNIDGRDIPNIPNSFLPTVVQLGDVSGTINTNASLGDIFDLTLTASGVLANPTNGVDGQSLRWRITYADSGIPLSLDANFNIPTSASNPLPFSAGSGVMDIFGATYDSSRNKWDVIAFVPGY